MTTRSWSDAVLVDATALPPSRGGVARYVVGLLQGLGHHGVVVHVVAKPGDVDWLRTAAPEHQYHVAPSWTRFRPARLLWEQVGLPLLCRRLGAVLLHSPHYTFPVLRRGPSSVTLHDATFFTAPDDHGLVKRLFFTTWTRLARSRADTLVVPSDSTRRDVVAATGVPRVPVHVAHLGVDLSVFRPPCRDEVTDFRRRLRLADDECFVAFLGTVEPRKNVGNLLDAHALLALGARPAPTLLVSGSAGWDEDAVDRLRRAGDVPGRPVRWLGYLPSEDLHVLLGAARAVVYASEAEGFGLPVLEAMASGGIVVTTRSSAVPEVGGDAVVYSGVSPDELAATLRGVLDGDHDDLRAPAVSRAATFTWERCAAVHLDAWEGVLSAHLGATA